jgi:hypothetical protein
MSDNSFRKKISPIYQDKIKKPPEKTDNRAQSTLIEKRVIHLPNGQEHVAEDTTLQKNENTGQWEKITKEMPITDASGRYIPPDKIAGKSWKRNDIPTDHFVTCLNPWEDHGYRLVYLKVDGNATESGNVLCKECYEKNKKKQQLKKWLGWFYDPETF